MGKSSVNYKYCIASKYYMMKVREKAMRFIETRKTGDTEKRMCFRLLIRVKKNYGKQKSYKCKKGKE